ncbi:MAG TPA: sulfate transporter family protein [Mesorhizobium sp.]|jgi:CysZ protein|nr:sulfate transporter family protein [Mesorhizobium sp.]
MIPAAISAALANLLSPEARSVFLKTVGAALAILIAGWFALKELLDWWVMPFVEAGLSGLPAWAAFLESVAAVFAGIVLAIGLALLMAPATALVAGLFLDDVAYVIERRDYPADPPGRAVPTFVSLVLSLKFLGVVILGNLFALFLLLVPGVNLVAFLLVNAYLLGREFFEFAAMRFRPEAEARAMRRQHRGTVFLAGLAIAGWLAVPLLNLTTPLFAAGLMVHLHKRLSRRAPAT